MAAQTRPYFIVLNGIEHMVEALSPAAAVKHLVGQAVTELRPARANEVLAWTRGDKPIQVAGQKAVPAATTTIANTAGLTDGLPADNQVQALACFQDWAGFDPTGMNTQQAHDTVNLFARMHPAGQMDLMTFDVLRQRAPEFGYAIVATECSVPRTDDEVYVAALEEMKDAGMARVRSRLEEEPMPFGNVVDAILHHAGISVTGADDYDPTDAKGDEDRLVTDTGHLDA